MDREELAAPLKLLPPVDFCCAYGSALLPNDKDKSTTMTDYILGVSDPLQWHSENLERNRHHYSSWMARLGPKTVRQVADNIGVGVHFNPFVIMNEKRMIKYGVVRMDDLVRDILNWERLYISGRLQKPVTFLVDSLNMANLNLANLRAAISAALLLLSPEFTEEDLYVKVCSLSYTGDVRMLFAEDKNKVKKIVQGHFHLFREMYKPFLDEYSASQFLAFSPIGESKAIITQDYGLASTSSLIARLPQRLRRQIEMDLGSKLRPSEFGRTYNHELISARRDAAKRIEKLVRRTVMVSSARQALSGFLAVGGANAFRYLASKVSKAWKSL